MQRLSARTPWIAAALSCLCWVSCATAPPPPPTMASVDLAKYAGSWYEIARLPMFFQRHCVASKAVYRIRPDQSFDVHNECLTASGHTATAEATATVVDPATNARLRVVFDNFFARLASPSNEGNYWILHVDADYRTALVGTPDRRYLWILARSKRLDDGVYQRLVDLARTLGYPVDTLIRDQWPDAS